MDDIFRISRDTEMTPQLLATYIQKNRVISARRYWPLWNAYNNRYRIFTQPKKPAWKPDNRLAVNFAKYITETFEGFFLGHGVSITAADETAEDFVNFTNAYNDQDDQNAELSRIVSIFGRGYEIYYTDDNAELCTAYLDPREGFMIYSESIKPRPMYFVRIYQNTKNIWCGSIADNLNVRYFKIDGGLRWDGEPMPHGFDEVPATEYVQNRARRGIFEDVMPLIDAYNAAISEKANDVDSFSDAYLKILGAKVDAETVKFMRTNRVINFAGTDAKELVVDFMQRPNGDQTQENLLERMERLIFTISMVANINAENFATSSGIALKYKLSSMSDLAKTKERKFISGMNRRYRILFSSPICPADKDAWTTLRYYFTQNFPADLESEAEIAGKLAGITSRKTQLQIISAVTDVGAELDQIRKEEDEENWATDYSTERTPGRDE